MLRFARSATGDHGDRNRFADRGGDFQIVSVTRSVGVHTSQDNLSGAQPLDFLGPRNGLQAGRLATAVDMNLPNLTAVTLDPFGVDVDHNALAAKSVGGATNEFRVGAGG